VIGEIDLVLRPEVFTRHVEEGLAQIACWGDKSQRHV